MESTFKKPERRMNTRIPFFEFGSSSRGIIGRGLGVLMVMVSAVSPGRAETSAAPFQQQLDQVRVKFALIKTDLIRRYQADETPLEGANHSSRPPTSRDSAGLAAGGSAPGDVTSQGIETRLREIAVLTNRLQGRGERPVSSDDAGPPSAEEMRLQLANRLSEANLSSQAEPILKDLAIQSRRPPIAAEAWFRLERLYYRQGDYPQALGAFFKIPMNKTWPFREEATYLAGNSYLYLKDNLKAIDLLSKIGEGSDYYPFAVYSSGLAYLNLGDAWSSTQLQFQKLIALNPKEDPVLQELINKTRVTLGFFFMDQKRYPEAVAVFEAIPPQSRYRAQARFGLGKAFMGMEDCVKAIVVFKDLIVQAASQSDALEAHLQIGSCYSKLSAYHRAVDSYQDALKAYSERAGSLKKLVQEIKTRNLEDWMIKSGTEKSADGAPFVFLTPSLAREPGFTELVNVYAEWFRLHEEMAEDVRRDGNLAGRKMEQGTGPDLGPLHMKMQELGQDLDKLLRASATHQISSQLAQIDELALRANLGIAKNMTFMQDHETVP
jgi:tetratricopeptide (TPR) repeat protein